MKAQLLVIVASAVRIAGFVGDARAQDCDPPGHLDVAVAVVDNQIRTGVADFNINPGSPTIVLGPKVWGARFQTDPLNPFFTDDPGYAAQAGSNLPAGSFVGFDVLDDLKYWDGTGQVQFGPVPNLEQLRIRLGGQNTYAGTGTGFVQGFFFAVVAANGTIHVHLSYFLYGADGNAVPATVDGVEATAGIYLLKLQLKSNQAGLASSDPVYIVFDNGPPDCAHCTALNEVAAHLAKDRPGADLDFDRDVDQDDFGHFQSCLTGPAIPWTDPCCQSADLDHDGDVDQSDFGLLQRCLSGADNPADPGCVD